MCLGPSMLPTFNRSGDVVLMERVSVMTGGVERGDVALRVRRQTLDILCVSECWEKKGTSSQCQKPGISVARCA